MTVEIEQTHSSAKPSGLEAVSGGEASSSRLIAAVLALTTLLGAFLLFLVQPMVGKVILPWFGGVSSVWTVCMLFFQTGLLAGYAYAHVLTRWASPMASVAIHVVLLTIACVSSSVLPSVAWKPEESLAAPQWHILLMLTACVGLPYALLAATSPLTQVWFARTQPSGRPYRLYALSNIGSLGALGAYPFLFEPMLDVPWQGFLWRGAFVAYALLTGLSVWLCRTPRVAAVAEDAVEEERTISWSDRFIWFFAPALSTTLMLAMTTHLSEDVAPGPLLWIAPLAIYLISFILTFESDRWYSRDLFAVITAVTGLASASLASSFVQVNETLTVPLLAHLSLLAASCMVCHGELARRRPAAKHLTQYYLAIAAGGALGGVFSALIAPSVFTSNLERPLAMLCVGLLLLWVLATDGRPWQGFKVVAGHAVFWSMLFCAYFLMQPDLGPYDSRIVRKRNFYSSMIMYDTPIFSRGEQKISGTIRRITHGITIHGWQILTDEKTRQTPTAYFTDKSGVGLLMKAYGRNTPRRIAVLGEGAATLAAYADSDDFMRFYEIDPQMAEIADNDFTFIKDARARGATIDVIKGDGRLLLEKERRENEPQYDLIVLDAFSSDAVPMHLLTTEAFDLYLDRLKEGGMIAANISTPRVELDRVVLGAARDKLWGRLALDGQPQGDILAASSKWILLSRDRGDIERMPFGEPLHKVVAEGDKVIWTDDRSNILSVINWSVWGKQ